MVFQNIMMGAAGQGGGGYEIDQSALFAGSTSDFLSEVFGTPTDNNVWTLSLWVKRSAIKGVVQGLFGAVTASSFYGGIYFLTDETLKAYVDNASVGNHIETTQVFRDPSAWYHIIWSADTDNATATNRSRLYLNGTEITAFDTDTQLSLTGGAINKSGSTFNIGKAPGWTAPFDGYLAEVHFIDGQQLTPASFGEYNDDGVWVPKAYAGAYGNNGAYLDFADSGALGTDVSGNGNNWTVNGTITQVTDTPTNNYATWNPLFFRRTGSYTPTFANGNLYVAGKSSQVSHTGTTIASTGKHYAEFLVNNGSSTITGPGVVRTLWDGGLAQSYASNFSGSYYGDNGSRNYNATSDSQTAPGVNRVGIEVDFANDEVEYFIVTSGGTKTSQGGKLTSANGIAFDGEGIFTATLHDSSARNITAYFEEADWYGTPNTGYVALNTANLPSPAITDGSANFQTTLYTGNGTAIGSGGNAVSQTENSTFQPDFVWIKGRSGATEHVLTDAVRGVTKELSSNDTGAEETVTEGLTTFGSAGFTVGSDGSYNTSSATYAGWQWLAANGTASNEDGSITSTVSTNTTAGFSIVRAASMATGTIGHGLSQAPDMVIGRMQSEVFNWWVWHQGLSGGTYSVKLNDTSAQAAVASVYTAEPTSTVINTGGSWTSGNPAIFYCFHEVEGFSKFGSFKGNNSFDGPFIYTGFKPAFVMAKRNDSTSDWFILDAQRPAYNVIGGGGVGQFPANLTYAESSLSTYAIADFLSNGFKVRHNMTYGYWNVSGGTYIYMAFAENPFGGEDIAPATAR